MTSGMLNSPTITSSSQRGPTESEFGSARFEAPTASTATRAGQRGSGGSRSISSVGLTATGDVFVSLGGSIFGLLWANARPRELGIPRMAAVLTGIRHYRVAGRQVLL